MNTIDLSEKDRATIVNALHLAASAYDQDSRLFATLNDSRLADGFDAQRREARKLAERIEQAETLWIEERS